MSEQQRRKYDWDFKRNAVRLSEEPSRTVANVAENLENLFKRAIINYVCIIIAPE
ncbi:MAG: hypothetical protein KJ826_04570 [Proteobacteria bacterium]|nr:hypothetical protein [Pseudomonadota bacterium]MBU4037451.1 hypothetical protein [Pseudomonadota bacterium]